MDIGLMDVQVSQSLVLSTEEVEAFQDSLRDTLIEAGKGDLADRVLPPKVDEEQPKRPKILEW